MGLVSDERLVSVRLTVTQFQRMVAAEEARSH